MSHEAFLEHYERATSSHDLDATLDLIAEDAIYLFSDRSSHIGKAAIRKVLESNFMSIKDETYNLGAIRWVAVSETVAACVYEFHWRGLIDGEQRSGDGRGSSVLKRTEGRWVVALEHLSAGTLT